LTNYVISMCFMISSTSYLQFCYDFGY